MEDPNNPTKEKPYTSKTKEGECKNILCKNKRANGSAYCKECSDNKRKI